MIDSAAQVVQRAGAVLFEAEQVFHRPEDTFDALPDRRKSQRVGCFRFVAAAWADDRDPERVGGLGELARGVALVDDDRVAAAVKPRQEVRASDLALFAVGADEQRRAWRAVGTARQVQPEAPKPSAVAAAAAIAGSVGELWSLAARSERIAASRTRH
jgi:hypothetical protein